MKKRTVDPRTVLLREAEARQGYRSHAELARAAGLSVATVQKRFRLPGTARLDELAAMTGGTLTAEESQVLINGGWKR